MPSMILPSRIRAPHIPIDCNRCNTALEFIPPTSVPRNGTILKVRCIQCQNVLEHAFYSGQLPAGAANSNQNTRAAAGDANGQSTANGARKSRKIGTQERPLETLYYEALGVPVDATSDDIKKAYRRLAIQHHPDKNPNDPAAGARFQAISTAYQTLSDPALRFKYNEFGASTSSTPDGGYMDPEEVFGKIFGGERFEDIFGKISLARDMKSALQEAEEADELQGEGSGKTIKDAKGREILTDEERKKKEEKDKKKSAEKHAARTARVSKLVANMTRKLSIFTESAVSPDDPDVTMSFRTICELEAEDLSHESYGPSLLYTIGMVYTFKAKAFLASSATIMGVPTFGVGGWFKNVQGKWDVFSETVSTLRAALDLKATFEALQAAETAGNLSPEERKRLEEQAAEKGLEALFKGTKLEIQSILRETCDIVLSTPSATNPTAAAHQAHMRAIALNIMGEAYMKFGNPHVDHKDPTSNSAPSPAGSGLGDDSEYVRVDTKKSRR
ncbi:DnaJ-domain-containing protein [Mycena floridula]|nr:DnaJ-domain-containing protein [Mycena floridula]